MSPAPIKAATVILLRDPADGPFEVYLLRRHDANPFMGGVFVYPGGKIDGEDWEAARTPGAAAFLRQREYRAASQIPRDEHLAACRAAIRELFEEAHVLLARIAGCPAAEAPTAVTERLIRLADQELHGRSFSGILSEAGVQPAIGELYYCANWVTPERRPVRFDTHFFVARLPAGQEPVADPKESSTGRWLTPERALEENLCGAIALSPPTLKTLEDIALFRTIDQVLSLLSSEPVVPILPVWAESADRTLLVFPNDSDYEAYRAGGPESPGGNGVVSAPGNPTTRLALAGQRWIPYSKVQ